MVDWNITSHVVPSYKCSLSVLWAWYLLSCMKNSLKIIPLTTYTLPYYSDLWSPTKDTTSKWPFGHDQCILHVLAVSSKGICDLSQFITLFLIGLCSSPCWEMCSVDHLVWKGNRHWNMWVTGDWQASCQTVITEWHASLFLSVIWHRHLHKWHVYQLL